MILSRRSSSSSVFPDSFLISAILYRNGISSSMYIWCVADGVHYTTRRTRRKLSFSVPVPRSVLREQYISEVEPDEMELIPEFEEGFDRVDFRTEFSPSPNLEGPQPQPRGNVSRNLPTVSSSPPRARTNNDGEYCSGGSLPRVTRTANNRRRRTLTRTRHVFLLHFNYA